LAAKYPGASSISKVLARWHNDITQGIKRNPEYSPHVNGFYMIFMRHGTWYDKYTQQAQSADASQSGKLINISKPTLSLRQSEANATNLFPSTIASTFNMLATDIDVPDLTEEYVSVSSRIRNSFVPSRNYFVSDFSVSYIENVNMEIIRYHVAWFKYLDLLKRGEIDMYTEDECNQTNSTDIFLDMPFTNAIWVAVFRPFTTDIQLLIKLIGVMPVTMPLKQVIGNRSASKLTVLNMQYKAADMFYKFYDGTESMLKDTEGNLYKSFNTEIIQPFMAGINK
jgi:hypothetical protein